MPPSESKRAMAKRVLEGQFKAWVREGRRVGALSHALEYDLDRDSGITSYYVVTVNARGQRERISNTVIPPLSPSSEGARAMLEAMTKAWSMVR